MPSNDETERQDSNPEINVVLTPEQIEQFNASFNAGFNASFKALLYYTTHPKQFVHDLFTSSKILYAYVINSYFNKRDEHKE